MPGKSYHGCRSRVSGYYPVWTTQVDVVGASLGGLVARLAAAPSADSTHPRRLNIVRLFSISSPHTGSKLADEITPRILRGISVSNSQLLKTLAKTDADGRYQLFPYVLLDDPIVGDRHACAAGADSLLAAESGAFPRPVNDAAI